MKTKPRKTAPPYPPLPPGSVLLALDVSSSACGWAVGKVEENRGMDVMDFGVIRPPSSRTSIERTDLMCMGIACIVKKHDPTEICMEFQGHQSTGKRIQGLAVLGQAQGAIRVYLAMTHRLTTVNERVWTKLDGRNARKEVRAEHVKQAVPAYAAAVAANPKFDPGLDVADALGILRWRVNQ